MKNCTLRAAKIRIQQIGARSQGTTTLDYMVGFAFITVLALVGVAIVGEQTTNSHGDSQCAMWHTQHSYHQGTPDHCKGATIHDWFYQ